MLHETSLTGINQRLVWAALIAWSVVVTITELGVAEGSPRPSRGPRRPFGGKGRRHPVVQTGRRSAPRRPQKRTRPNARTKGQRSVAASRRIGTRCVTGLRSDSGDRRRRANQLGKRGYQPMTLREVARTLRLASSRTEGVPRTASPAGRSRTRRRAAPSCPCSCG
jgi:hypothetical protein